MLNGSPLIPDFDSGQDSYFNEFGFMVENNEPVSTDTANSILFGSEFSDLKETLKKYGVITMAMNEDEGDFDFFGDRFAPCYSKDPEARIPHAHNHFDFMAFYLEAGKTRLAPTLFFGRRAVAATLAKTYPKQTLRSRVWGVSRAEYKKKRAALMQLLETGELYDDEKYTEDSPEVVIEHAFDTILGTMGARNFCHWLADFQAELPEDGYLEVPWDEEDDFSKIVVFDANTPMHALGNPPESYPWVYKEISTIIPMYCREKPRINTSANL